MKNRSIAYKLCFISGLVSFAISFSFLLIFASFAKEVHKNNLTKDLDESIGKSTTFILGYFYGQKNWVHLEEHQRAFNHSPNIVYSYITNSESEIELGIDGLDSFDVGTAKQSWEPQGVQSLIGSLDFKLQDDGKIPEKISKFSGKQVTLIRKEITCEHLGKKCGHMVVAASFDRINSQYKKLLIQSVALASILSILIAGIIFLFTRKAISPLSSISDSLRNFKNGNDLKIQVNHIPFKKIFNSSFITNYKEIEDLREAYFFMTEQKIKIESLLVDHAIAKTTQMLAHDIRKPFSMMQIMIKLLRSAKNHESSQALLYRLGPDIDKAMATVNVMLAEVMEVGADTKLNSTEVEFGSLLDQSLNQVFSHGVKSDIKLEYNVSLSHLLNVDAFKITRVFTNLLSNAADAMQWKGKIVISAREHLEPAQGDKDGTAQTGKIAKIEIFNAGSYISNEDLPHIFEAFFTKGKDSGTGLGLAITRKIINAHGGEITCESIRDVGVTFRLTLPLGAKEVEREISLPENSNWYYEKIAGLSVNQERISPDLNSNEDLSKLTDLAVKRQKSIKILLIDDESFYRTSIIHLLDSLGNAIRQAIEVTEISNSADADTELSSTEYDLVITDIDLGPKSSDGFEIVKKFRLSSPEKSFLCIHSNRISEADSEKAYQAGAQAFVPKPMGKEHLIRLILESIVTKSK